MKVHFVAGNFHNLQVIPSSDPTATPRSFNSILVEVRRRLESFDHVFLIVYRYDPHKK